jgi:hypothetical protein
MYTTALSVAASWLVILGVFVGVGYVLTRTSKKSAQGSTTGGQPPEVPGDGTGPIADQ